MSSQILTLKLKRYSNFPLNARSNFCLIFSLPNCILSHIVSVLEEVFDVDQSRQPAASPAGFSGVDWMQMDASSVLWQYFQSDHFSLFI